MRTVSKAGKGDQLDWVNNTGVAVDLWEVVEAEDLMGVVCAGAMGVSGPDTSIAAGATGKIEVEGLYQVPKATGQAWKAGDEIRWDSTNKRGNLFGFGIWRLMGVAAYPAAENATVAYVRLNAAPKYDAGLRYEYLDHFRGKSAPAAAASVVDGPWAKADTSSAGSPTLTTLDSDAGGAIKGLLDNTNEVQNLCLYHGDIKSFDVDDKLLFEARVKLADVAASGKFRIGLAGNRNDDPDAIAQSVFFAQDAAALDLLAESDDGTTEVAATDTLQNLTADTYVHLGMDLRDKSNIKLYVNGERVLSGTTFTLAAYTGKLQPLVQLQKTAATATQSFTLDLIRIRGQRQAAA